MTNKTILFLTPYPYSTAPSQRFRFEQYYQALQQQGIQYKAASFLDDNTWKILYYPGKTVEKTLGIIKGFLRRFFLLFSSKQ